MRTLETPLDVLFQPGNEQILEHTCFEQHAFFGRFIGCFMTTDGVVQAAGFRRMNEERRRSVENWNAFQGPLWDVTATGATDRGYRATS